MISYPWAIRRVCLKDALRKAHRRVFWTITEREEYAAIGLVLKEGFVSDMTVREALAQRITRRIWLEMLDLLYGKGLSLEEVAERLGVDRSTIGRWFEATLLKIDEIVDVCHECPRRGECP